MEKVRILGIAPYEGLYRLMSNIAEQRSDVDLIIHLGNLEDGLAAAMKTRDQGINAIISRGGTVEAIRQQLDVPVCDIVPSVFDVLRTIRLAQGTGGEFAVVGFPSITKPALMLRDIMQYHFQVITIHSPAECREHLQALRAADIKVVVGDMLATRCAVDYGMQGLLIVSGLESVEAAIDDAKEMCARYWSLERSVQLLRDLLGLASSQFVVFSSDGKEVFSSANNAPDKLIEMMRQHTSDVLAHSPVKFTRNSDNETWTANGRLLKSGDNEYCVYEISKVPRQKNTHGAIHYYDPSGNDQNNYFQNLNPLEFYLGNTETAERILTFCNQYARTPYPVLIEGAAGTGKDRLAQYIYLNSELKHSTFVVIDVASLQEEDWNFLLEDFQSPLIDTNITIYMRQLDLASEEACLGLLQFFQDSRTLTTNRFLFSRTSDVVHDPNNKLFLYLSECCHCLHIRIPELSKRPHDIPSLASLYINATNVRHGTRVIGLTKDAMLRLQNHTWTRNMDQLIAFVQNLVIYADSSYISESQVQELLDIEKDRSTTLFSDTIDLNRSLDEITREIVQRVYQIENMNQTKTANHLHISRSTLWRIMKKTNT